MANPLEFGLLLWVALVLLLGLPMLLDDLVGWAMAHARVVRQVSWVALVVSMAGWLGIALALVTR